MQSSKSFNRKFSYLDAEHFTKKLRRLCNSCMLGCVVESPVSCSKRLGKGLSQSASCGALATQGSGLYRLALLEFLPEPDRQEPALPGWCLTCCVKRRTVLGGNSAESTSYIDLVSTVLGVGFTLSGPSRCEPQECDGHCPKGLRDARHRDVGRNPQ